MGDALERLVLHLEQVISPAELERLGPGFASSEALRWVCGELDAIRAEVAELRERDARFETGAGAEP